jgi:addiction module HigA family antidote
MRMHSPPHPGRFVRDEIIEPLELSVTAAARVLGVSRPAVSKVNLLGTARVTSYLQTTR